MYFEFVPPVIKYILMMFRIIVIPEKKKVRRLIELSWYLFRR